MPVLPTSPRLAVLDDPALESLLARTLTLMTGVAGRCALGHPPGCHAQCRLMLATLGVQLEQLGRHPGLSPGFRQHLARLHGRWQGLAGGGPAQAEAA